MSGAARVSFPGLVDPGGQTHYWQSQDFAVHRPACACLLRCHSGVAEFVYQRLQRFSIRVRRDPSHSWWSYKLVLPDFGHWSIVAPLLPQLRYPKAGFGEPNEGSSDQGRWRSYHLVTWEPEDRDLVEALTKTLPGLLGVHEEESSPDLVVLLDVREVNLLNEDSVRRLTNRKKLNKLSF